VLDQEERVEVDPNIWNWRTRNRSNYSEEPQEEEAQFHGNAEVTQNASDTAFPYDEDDEMAEGWNRHKVCYLLSR